MRVLSLCSGIGGLELAIGGEVVAFAETAKAPSAVLAAHWPSVPNIGDWTELDSFDDLAPDLVTGGLPCQPVSHAGARQGDMDDRWLFDDLVDLIGRSRVRPSLFLENVPGLLMPVFRTSFYRFMDGLMGLGYGVDTGVVSAADAGAPHLRRRWFAVCRPPGTAPPELLLKSPTIPTSISDILPTPLAKSNISGGSQSRDLTDLLPTPTASLDRGTTLLPTPLANERPRHTRARLIDLALPNYRADAHPTAKYMRSQLITDAGEIHDWKVYQPAIDRWTRIVGRPPPTRIQQYQLRSLHAPFVEWIMGFPDGWTAQISNAYALRVLGNAVVPQQARLAAARLQLDLAGTND